MSAVNDPKSRVGEGGVVFILLLLTVFALTFGPSPRTTLYHHYRPVSWFSNIRPWVFGLLWSVGLAMILVSFYYLVTVTSNNGWINNLFPDESYSYDVAWGLQLTLIMLIVGFPSFMRWLDEQYFYSMAGVSLVELPWDKNAVSLENQKKLLKARTEMSDMRRTGSQSGGMEQRSTTALTTKEFAGRVEKYHVQNMWVKWGTFIYALIVLGFGATILGFYATKYSYAKHDNSFLVIFWTFFVALCVMLVGFIFNCISSFYAYGEDANNQKKKDERERLITPEVVEMRETELKLRML